MAESMKVHENINIIIIRNTVIREDWDEMEAGDDHLAEADTSMLTVGMIQFMEFWFAQLTSACRGMYLCKRPTATIFLLQAIFLAIANVMLYNP